MRKNYFGRQFKRDTNERKALFKGLLSALVMRERIITTEAKAKAIKPSADKLITKAKKNGLLAKRLLAKELTPEATEKIIAKIAPRFAKRSGGYTRMIRFKRRLSDNAPMMVIEWVEKEAIDKKSKTEKGEVKKESKETGVEKALAIKRTKKGSETKTQKKTKMIVKENK